MEEVENREKSSEPQKSFLNVLEIGVFEVVFALTFLLIIFGTLNYFNILRLDYAFPFLSFLPRQNKEVSKSSSVNKGNPFNKPVQLKNNLLFSVITGHVVEIGDSKDGSGNVIYLQKPNGELVKDPLFVPKELKLTIVVSKAGKTTQKEAPFSELFKKDFVIVSINEDPASGKKEVTGIRINRFE